MSWILQRLCRICHAIGVWHCILVCERAIGWKRHAIVLLYHHISDDKQPATSLSGVEDGTPVTHLDAQLHAFRQWYEPCTSDDLIAAVHNSRRFDRDRILVTFDDAYIDNRTLAGPLLRSRGFPALVFVATGFVESPNRFWWVRLNDILRSASAERLAAAVVAFVDAPNINRSLAEGSVASWSARRSLRSQLACVLQSMTESQREEILDRLQEALGIDQTTCLPLLTWSDMYEMQREGFEFGAHTVSHPRMTGLAPMGNGREIEACASEMERRLGQRPSSFAYPYGNYNKAVKSQVEIAGFQLAFTASPGAFSTDHTPALEIPRIQPSWNDPSKLITFIVLLKLSKYFPQSTRSILSTLMGEPFHLQGTLDSEEARNNGN